MNATGGISWFSWKRLAILAVTVVALVVLFRRIDSAAFLRALGSMQPGWFLLAVGSYGVAFLFAAWRWHLALRVTGMAVHSSASARLYCIGHYFFISLFGGVTGDIAKSSLYARWYGRPFPEVFAAAPLDRALGFAGLMVFGAGAFAWAAAHESLAHIDSLQLRLPGQWAGIGLALGVIGIILLVVVRPRGEGAAPRLLRAMQNGAGRMVRHPQVAVKGLACGVLVQVALSGVLALNLRAIVQTPLPWAQLLWTFPVISMLSSLPVTVAGLGVREGAAILLLGFYGVPAADAVAASLLSLATSLVWAGVGGSLLWREEILRSRHSGRQVPKTISVVMPTLNEEADLQETLQRLRALPELHEIIVVDGGSRDGTVELAGRLGCRVLVGGSGRGSQMRLGAAAATGDVVLLLHADTWLPPDAAKALLTCLQDPLVVAGGFWKIFRQRLSPLLLGSRWKCAIRFYLGRRVAGDQGLFVRREVLEQIGGVPAMPLMEEFELCRRLHGVGRLALADATIITSARRFAKFGVVRTYLRMWYVTTRYRLGTSPEKLRRIYEQLS